MPTISQRPHSDRGPHRPPPPGRALARLAVTCLLACALTACPLAGVTVSAAASGQVGPGALVGGGSASAAPGGEGNQLESAAHRAGATGRNVAMSLIALGFAIAAIVLAFRRDFKEAVGVLAIGVVAVLLAQETGVKLVENLVHALFGG